ncbi:MAG TPA: hypothetical protein VK053_04495 [Jiangellaceae bacterium]|nr:hypothetical protein [Jiangellaceae bacterium]
MYFLVLLRESTVAAEEEDHEPFIDSLVARNLILLGGSFDEPIDGAVAAYILRCDDEGQAHSIVAEDPLVLTGIAEPLITRWDVIGVNRNAIEADLTSD